jgi:hypothetical protein
MESVHPRSTEGTTWVTLAGVMGRRAGPKSIHSDSTQRAKERFHFIVTPTIIIFAGIKIMYNPLNRGILECSPFDTISPYKTLQSTETEWYLPRNYNGK